MNKTIPLRYLALFKASIVLLSVSSLAGCNGENDRTARYAGDKGIEDRSKIGVDKPDIKVNVENGNVTLSGQVENPRDAELAEDIILSDPEVNKVKNEIAVEGQREMAAPNPPEGTQRGTEIAKKFAMNLDLLVDQSLSGATISAKPDKDTVTLEGVVETELERKLVQEKVEKESGLKVENKLRVGSGKSLNELASQWLGWLLNAVVVLPIIAAFTFLIVMLSLLKRRIK